MLSLKLIGSGFKPTLAYASESATDCGYENVFRFHGLGFPSPHLDMPGLGQGFKGYNRWILLSILIKIWNTRHTPLNKRDL
jgi:hypothetical protein